MKTDVLSTKMPRALWVLLVGQLIVKAAAFSYPFMAFLLRDRGYGASTTGWVLLVFGCGWLGGQLLCGWLADRAGRRTTLIATMLLGAAVLPVFAMTRFLPTLLAAALVAGIVYDAPRPIIGAAAADLLQSDADRIKAMGLLHWCSNIGAATVGAAGGLLASRLGAPALMLINAAACAAFAAITARYVPPDHHTHTRQQGRYRQALADRHLWLLCGASVSAFTLILGMYSSLSMLMAADRLPPSAYGIVECSAAVTVILLTPQMSRWLSRAKDMRLMAGAVAAGTALMGIGMATAALSHTTVGYAAFVVASCPPEIAFMISAPALLTRLAPDHLRGRYFGVWGVTIALASGIAPLLTSWSIGHGGKPMAAATTVAVGLLGATCCIPLAYARKRRPNQAKLTTEVTP